MFPSADAKSTSDGDGENSPEGPPSEEGQDEETAGSALPPAFPDESSLSNIDNDGSSTDAFGDDGGGGDFEESNSATITPDHSLP